MIPNKVAVKIRSSTIIIMEPTFYKTADAYLALHKAKDVDEECVRNLQLFLRSQERLAAYSVAPGLNG